MRNREPARQHAAAAMAAPVLLGTPGDWVLPTDPADAYDTKAGGPPVWPGGATPPPKALTACPRCGAATSLVLQVCCPRAAHVKRGVRLTRTGQAYAPLRASELSPPGGADLPERYLYLFACLAPECRNEPDAWRAVRAQRPSAPAGGAAAATATPPAPPPPAPPVTDWSAAADDWSGVAPGDGSQEGGAQQQQPGGELHSLARALDAALAVSTAGSGGSKPRVAAASPAAASGGAAFQRRPAGGPNSLPEFFISAEDEPEDDDSGARVVRADPKAMPMEAMAAALAGGGDGGDGGDKSESWAGEAYESTAVRGVPKHYLRFQKRLRRCPEQCVRYGVACEPMWPTTARPPAWLAAQHQLPAQQQRQGSAAPGTTCAGCGGFLRVEAQLMAPLIHFFCQGADSGSPLSDALLDWEWTTAVLLTCGRVRAVVMTPAAFLPALALPFAALTRLLPSTPPLRRAATPAAARCSTATRRCGWTTRRTAWPSARP